MAHRRAANGRIRPQSTNRPLTRIAVALPFALPRLNLPAPPWFGRGSGRRSAASRRARRRSARGDPAGVPPPACRSDQPSSLAMMSGSVKPTTCTPPIGRSMAVLAITVIAAVVTRWRCRPAGPARMRPPTWQGKSSGSLIATWAALPASRPSETISYSTMAASAEAGRARLRTPARRPARGGGAGEHGSLSWKIVWEKGTVNRARAFSHALAV